MVLPIQGPENPFEDGNRFKYQNALAGHVEEQAMTDYDFKVQQQTFNILGYSTNPSIDPKASPILGSLTKAEAHKFSTLDNLKTPGKREKELKRKRRSKGNLAIVEGEGSYSGPWASWTIDDPKALALDVTDGETVDKSDSEIEEVGTSKRPKKSTSRQEASIFHGKSFTDYQGRTYMSPPLAEAPHLMAEPGSQETFIPKVCIRTWTGHTQGVSVIRLFPQTAHLLLSGSMDTKIKVCRNW